MSGAKKKERSKKQSILIAVVLFFICCLLGMIVGEFAFSRDGEAETLAEIFSRAFHAASPVIVACMVCATLFFIGMMIRYRVRMKRLYNNLSSDDESDLNKMDKMFSKAGIVMAFAVPLELVFMSVMMYLQFFGDTQEERALSFWVMTVAFLIIVVGYYVTFFLYRSIVELHKKVNPEKKGELLDLFFQRQWENSSDEAQKRILYEAGYRGYITMLHITYIMEAVAFVSMTLFHTGIVPCLLIGVIAVSGTVVSALTQYRLEQRGWEE